ncbi:MAG: hypothetical protein K2N72_11310 [Oscillospiraceae bacterium]|nr:hypothetical protein [Oscillospiraceae bacterium]
MNCNELKKRLKEKNIARHRYSIMGLKYPDDRCCIIFEDGLWKCYYSERGEMFGLKEFTSEDEACEYFFGWVTE